MKKYVAEIIGTFALVFCGTGAIIINEETHGTVTHIGVAITFGLIVMSMIYALGRISGAHLNPAVTIAFAINRTFAWKQVLPYAASQVAGAVAASLLLHGLFPDNEMLGSTVPSGPDIQSFVLEWILSFFLMLVILSVASGSKEQGLFAGLAIGGVVALEALFAGPVCGASMNPARSLAPALVSGHMAHLWLYLTAPVLGMLCAVFIWRYLSK